MSRRLLIITGNAPLGDALQDRFQELGFAVLASPPELLAQRLSHWGRPDVILLDLPAEGAEAPGALRSRFDPPPLLLALTPPGTTDPPPPGLDAAVHRPVEFDELASVVELQLAGSPELNEAKRLERSQIKPFTGEVSHAGTGRRTQYDRQGVRVLNLDLGGACFESLVDFQGDNEISLWLPVPGETKRMRLKAEIRWCKRQGAHAFVGCRFVTLDAEDLQRLDRILDAQRKP